jgi:hypothetical protein
MEKQHRHLKQILLSTLSALSLAGLIAAQVFMVFEATQTIWKSDSEDIKGQVGLRKYFDSGTGTSEDPYVITRPIHFYNLCRLQALGAFSQQKYFSLGKQIDGTGDYFFYANDTSQDLNQTYLNMQDYAYPFISVGTTANPFFGIFEGHDKTIANMTISSDPEDIGVFGYIASGGKVQNTRFANLTVTDNGYGSFVSDFYTAGIETNSSINLLSYNSSPLTTTSQTFTDLTKTFALDTSGITSAMISYKDVTYAIRSTNSTILKVASDNKSITLDTSVYPFNDSTSAFMTTNATAKERIYVTGSIVHDNVLYAKILSSYLITIKDDHSSGSPVLSLSVVKDDPSAENNYHHQTNIGFIAGHADGSILNCFVYNGTFSLNNSVTGYTPMKAETDLGLVGEVGVNIDNTLSPTKGLQESGDTGIINFTSIYNNVRGTQTTATGPNSWSTGGTNYSYYAFTPESGSLYNDCLRTHYFTTDNVTTLKYITGKKNSLDFNGQQLIKENTSKTRGLGVFQLNTDNSDSTSSVENFPIGLNNFAITYDSAKPFTSVYYTTAELDATEGGTTTAADFFGTANNITKWVPNTTSSRFRINQGTTLPTPSEISSFNSSSVDKRLESVKFERNNNYIIKFDLATSSNNYFSGTTNYFLKDYFKYKLVDASGNHLTDTTASNFGVMIKEKSGSALVNTTSFNSYLQMTPPTNGVIPTMTIDGSLCPSRTIEFSVKNIHGANITIIGRSMNGSGSYISIYNKANLTSADNTLGSYPEYSMYLPNYSINDTAEAQMPYYFNYSGTDVSSSPSMPTLTNGKVNEERLYAHTFFVPKGDYYIGSPTKNAYIYYIAAQGQNDQGNASNEKTVYIGADEISNIDFLNNSPIASDFALDTDRAKLSLTGYFSANNGTFNVTANASKQTVITYGNSSLLKALIYNQEGKPVIFGSNAATNDTIIEYNWTP